ncbi:hypothetical protein [Bacillus xiapuensis]|uniref:Uncharacterized protein n=1 Tax=Bacillus xiapuensis TaxID=2014075 RepID=A0ABU6N7V3_9BACI|nr:hypothetical protein [Bacillus xiapuensis]
MNQLKSLIEEMLVSYRENDCFEEWQLNQILSFAEQATDKISRNLYKFYIINTQIASNGGVPVLKQVYNMI